MSLLRRTTRARLTPPLDKLQWARTKPLDAINRSVCSIRLARWTTEQVAGGRVGGARNGSQPVSLMKRKPLAPPKTHSRIEPASIRLQQQVVGAGSWSIGTFQRFHSATRRDGKRINKWARRRRRSVTATCLVSTLRLLLLRRRRLHSPTSPTLPIV